MRKKPGQPDSVPSSWLSQSSVLAKRLCTTRTTQMPPPRASTLHSSAMGGEPGTQPLASAANIRGGSQAVTTERDSMPGPKFNVTATGFPSRSSNSVGTNQDEIPGPVAMACQTSSGVPGTSTSTWTERRPEASFFTLMMAPWDRLSAAEGAPRPPGDARGRRGRIHRGRATEASGSLRSFDEDDIRFVPGPIEEQLAAVRGNIEITDRKTAAERRELPLASSLEIAHPELLVGHIP